MICLTQGSVKTSNVYLFIVNSRENVSYDNLLAVRYIARVLCLYMKSMAKIKR